MAVMSCWPFNLSNKRPGKRFGHAGIEGYVVSWSFTGNRSRSQACPQSCDSRVPRLRTRSVSAQTLPHAVGWRGEKRKEKAGLAQTILSGRSTHLPRRGRYGGDLGRILGFPVQAGHAHRPQHSIPFMSIFPRGVHSPHEVTIGLPHVPVKRSADLFSIGNPQ